MLDTDRQADHVLADAGLGQFCFVELAVGGRGWVAGQGLGVADIHQAHHQLQGVDKARTSLDAAMNAKRQDACRPTWRRLSITFSPWRTLERRWEEPWIRSHWYK